MLKINCVLAFLVLSFTSFAQQTQEGDTKPTAEPIKNEYKPSSGETSLEVQFEPFGNNPIDINGIRARFFSSPRKAFRLNVFLRYDVDSEITQQDDPDNNLLELRNRTAVFALNIRPGYEWHLKGTERLSPYFGCELDLGYQLSRSRTESQNNMDVNYLVNKNVDGFFRAGANAIAGLDFYVSKKLFLGTEFGFGGSVTWLSDITRDSDLPGFEEPEPINRGSTFDLGPNVNVDIRLGYVF